ncbi:DUF2255 family protein [Streptomyces sp. NPDC051572]|uniref:DUF2255 family protein n=1 Tax=unclassified Streptomyces TaxID=2593676 RepID=UPI00344F33FD
MAHNLVGLPDGEVVLPELRAGVAVMPAVRAGPRIRIGGTEHEVAFAPADRTVLDAVDDAYRVKYASSPYLEPMLRSGPRSTTIRITPAAQTD